MTAVIEDGLATLKSATTTGAVGDEASTVVEGFAAGVEALLDPVLTVLVAAQSDAELRDGVAGYLRADDLGPHRGVLALGGYLAAQQARGTIRDDVDPVAVAFLVIGSCFMRVGQRQLIECRLRFRAARPERAGRDPDDPPGPGAGPAAVSRGSGGPGS